VTGSDEKIETSKLARALERDQQEHRQDDEAAMLREESSTERLAAELARRTDRPPAF
jgi:hypothetical protein